MNRNFYQQLYNRVANSFAIAAFSLQKDIDGGPKKPEHPVTIFHGRTGQPVTLHLLSDQGNDVTLLKDELASKLGFSDYMTRGIPLGVQGVGGTQQRDFFVVPARMQIGNLKPIRTMIAFGPTPKNLLGRESAIGRYYTLYGPDNIAYIETNSFENAMEIAQAKIRNQSLYAYQTCNAGCNCRNRM